jgi:hypothetical protein
MLSGANAHQAFASMLRDGSSTLDNRQPTLKYQKKEGSTDSTRDAWARLEVLVLMDAPLPALIVYAEEMNTVPLTRRFEDPQEARASSGDVLILTNRSWTTERKHKKMKVIARSESNNALIPQTHQITP